MLRNPLLIIGFVLVLVGAVLPFLIVIRLIESTFFLNFVAFSASVAGIFMGVIGTAMHVADVRRQDEWHNKY